MPTPSITSSQLPSLSLASLSTRGTCPPEIADQSDSWNISTDDTFHSTALIAVSDLQPELAASLQDAPSMDQLSIHALSDIKAENDVTVDLASPTASVLSQSTQIKDERPGSPSHMSSISTPSYVTSLSREFSNIRLLPDHPCSFLRAGSKFVGTQQSDRQVYNVDVEIKDVNMEESFLCGYLRIQGLTEDHPTLTTYFEGEIIGTKHTFQTQHHSWGATDKTDMHHWARFPAWRPIAKIAKKPDFTYKNFAQREHIFMRWKEYFLVPDHRVRTINGASFEGFYYICFNQVKGTVSGIYFHAKSEKYQQLELKHVENRGCFGAMEFR
ncbi:hypothetical protein LOZ66_006898 [Ophidiomyces ophidiicola]|nr:hypothetical protein LOZ66_006898 [Ophidiomyces ophidiicola]